jgi:hypothetical protein
VPAAVADDKARAVIFDVPRRSEAAVEHPVQYPARSPDPADSHTAVDKAFCVL